MAARYTQIDPVQFTLPMINPQALASAVQARQQRFDVSYAMAQDLSNTHLESLQQDRQMMAEWKQGIQDEIDSAVTKHEGDYSRIYKDLGALKRRVTKDMQVGAPGQAFKNYQLVQDWMKRSRDRDNVLQSQVNAGANYILGNYKGVEFNEATGTYNQIAIEELADYVDESEFITQALDNLVAEEGGNEWLQAADGRYIVVAGNEFKELDQKRITNAVQNAMLASPKYLEYAMQRERFSGKSNEDAKANVLSYIDDFASKAGKDYSYRMDKNTLDVKSDSNYGKDALLQSLYPPTDSKSGPLQESSMDQYRMKEGTPLLEWIGSMINPHDPASYMNALPKVGAGTKKMPELKGIVDEIGSELPSGLKRAWEGIMSAKRDENGDLSYKDLEQGRKEFNSVIDDWSSYTLNNPMLSPALAKAMQPTWSEDLKTSRFVEVTNGRARDSKTYREMLRSWNSIGREELEGMKVPMEVATIDGVTGLRWVDPKGKRDYLITNTRFHDDIVRDAVMDNNLTALFNTGEAQSFEFKMPNAVPGGGGGYSGYTPTKMSIWIGDKGQLEGTTSELYTYKDENGDDQVAYTKPEHMNANELKYIYGYLKDAQATELSRNRNAGSPFLNVGDAKSTHDILMGSIFSN